MTNYVMCVFMVYKFAYTVVSAYLKDIYCRFRRVRKIISDNESEFKTQYSQK